MRQDKPTAIDIQQSLARLPLFAALNPEQIAQIAANARAKRLHKGAILFQKGDPCRGFHVVLSGQIKLAFRSVQGDEKVVEIISPNQSFGEAVMFLNRPYPVYAEALADTQLVHIASVPIFDMLDRDSSFARKMLAGLSIRLHALIQDVESYSLHSSAQRVIGYLLEHCAQESEGQGEVSLPTSKQVIASRLNLTPETLSRIFHDLSDAGLITVSGKQIMIHDLRRLREFGL
jgi:CRP-like cAMP-binding protein